MVVCAFIEGIIFAIFFAGPLLYYPGIILNSNALEHKFITEGVKLQGRVVAQQEQSGEGVSIYHVKVGYQVDNERYVTNEMHLSNASDSKPMLNLI